MNKRKIRLGQTISPSGVGAIVEIRGESFVAEDINKWKVIQTTPIDAPRVASLLGISTIRSAASAHSGLGTVPFLRFPRSLFCPKCRTIHKWTREQEQELEAGKAPECQSSECSSNPRLTPMRFVTVCGNGHLSDVDWSRWAHSTSGPNSCRVYDNLKFVVRKKKGSGLESLAVVCGSCKSERNLGGIASPATLSRMKWKCDGGQPWQKYTDRDECDAPPIIVQRGASNVHFPDIASVLDIPPDSNFSPEGKEYVEIKNDHVFLSIIHTPSHPFREGLTKIVAECHDVDIKVVERLIQDELHSENGVLLDGVEFSEETIRREEFFAFLYPSNRPEHHKDKFITEHVNLNFNTIENSSSPTAELLKIKIEVLVKATRLREIRVLRGFRRYDLQNIVKADLGAGRDWLPGIEILGEGIFVAFKDSAVAEWESQLAVKERVKSLEDRREKSFFSTLLPSATPRFVMMHTFSHMLIRQLVHEAGYQGSSLRERLYVSSSNDSQKMAGVLIYTTAGDSEGTLGGLVRAGDLKRFSPIVLNALQRAAWCSLDPVCLETDAQGPDGLSKAACHACSLTSETSCANSNHLLDRALIIDPEIGFFSDVLKGSTFDLAKKRI